MVRDVGLDHLSKFEHHLQVLLAILQRRGFRLDVPYVERLRADLLAEAEEFKRVARRYGVREREQHRPGRRRAGRDGRDDERADGVRAPKVDKGCCCRWRTSRSAGNGWTSGRRTRWPTRWSAASGPRSGRPRTREAFLDLRDADDRLHPMIGALQARTARMSISRPPLQQLPSSDWRVRRAFVADPGQTIIAARLSGG
ncbi:hypothetical protein [Micromonospora echinospora]|uniref:hypothetical protein n=1 Tax=Micromonospora echinospora TaxID=1877 RepID=UPI0012FD89CA|nr:hypothetical protein [Micromonospora echinospora]